MDFWGINVLGFLTPRFFRNFLFSGWGFFRLIGYPRKKLSLLLKKSYFIVCKNFKNFAKICFVLWCSIKCINLTNLDQIWCGPLDFRLRSISTSGIKFIDKFTQNSSRKKFDYSSFSPYPLKVYQIFLSIE